MLKTWESQQKKSKKKIYVIKIGVKKCENQKVIFT